MFHDFFAEMFGGVPPGFGGPPPPGGGGGGGRPRQKRKTQTPPSVVDLPLTLEELYTGCAKHLAVERTRTCATCAGSGAKPGRQAKPCVKCSGQGQTFAMKQMGPYIQRVPIRCTLCEGRGLKVRDQDACVGLASLPLLLTLTDPLPSRLVALQVQEVQGRTDREGQEARRLSRRAGHALWRDDRHQRRGRRVGASLPPPRPLFSPPSVTNAQALLSACAQPDSSAPGDLHITVRPLPHPTFVLVPPRSPSSPSDLSTTLSLTLSESLLGFSRLILVHLDGRGLRVAQPGPGQRGWRVLKGGDEVVVPGEGMWRAGRRGDLVLRVEVAMPDEQWAMGLAERGGVETLRGLLPPRRPDLAKVVVEEGKETDEVELEEKKEQPEEEEQWVRVRLSGLLPLSCLLCGDAMLPPHLRVLTPLRPACSTTAPAGHTTRTRAPPRAASSSERHCSLCASSCVSCVEEDRTVTVTVSPLHRCNASAPPFAFRSAHGPSIARRLCSACKSSCAASSARPESRACPPCQGCSTSQARPRRLPSSSPPQLSFPPSFSPLLTRSARWPPKLVVTIPPKSNTRTSTCTHSSRRSPLITLPHLSPLPPALTALPPSRPPNDAGQAHPVVPRVHEYPRFGAHERD